jgi:hypothetical protein
MDFQICVLVQHMCCYLGVISPLFRHTTVIYTSHLNDEVPEPPPCPGMAGEIINHSLFMSARVSHHNASLPS